MSSTRKTLKQGGTYKRQEHTFGVAPPITVKSHCPNTSRHRDTSASNTSASNTSSGYAMRMDPRQRLFSRHNRQTKGESSEEITRMDRDPETLELSSVTQMSTAESSAQERLSPEEEDSFASRESIKKYVYSCKSRISEMESFLRQNDSQANLRLGDDDDDLDNELRELSEAERALHDEMECFFVPRQIDDTSSQAGDANFISIHVRNDESSDTASLEVSDLDDSNHTFGNIKKKLYSDSESTASDDIVRLKIKHHSSSFDSDSTASDSIVRMKIKQRKATLLHLKDSHLVEDADNNSGYVSLKPQLRSQSSTDADKLSPTSVATSSFINLAQKPLTFKPNKKKYVCKSRSSYFCRSLSELSDDDASTDHDQEENFTMQEQVVFGHEHDENSITQEESIMRRTAPRAFLPYQQDSPSCKQKNSLHQPQETESIRLMVENLTLESDSDHNIDQDANDEQKDDVIKQVAKGLFDRHEYKIKPLLTHNEEQDELTRTYEGTLMVYFASWMAIGFLHGKVPHTHFWMTVLVIPPVVALIETNLPHETDEAAIALGLICCGYFGEKMFVDKI
mmetsp:Transcript_15165/g.20087  ORF Transcript_15165/g.20087 Transcript_15165/m.20087 type:complete len:567 (+) Transcript_15165:3-1703(+)